MTIKTMFVFFRKLCFIIASLHRECFTFDEGQHFPCTTQHKQSSEHYVQPSLNNADVTIACASQNRDFRAIQGSSCKLTVYLVLTFQNDALRVSTFVVISDLLAFFLTRFLTTHQLFALFLPKYFTLLACEATTSLRFEHATSSIHFQIILNCKVSEDNVEIEFSFPFLTTFLDSVTGIVQSFIRETSSCSLFLNFQPVATCG